MTDPKSCRGTPGRSFYCVGLVGLALLGGPPRERTRVEANSPPARVRRAPEASSSVPDVMLQTVLARLSLSVQAMAASGLSATDTGGVVGAVKAQLASQPGALDAADATLAATRKKAESLERLVRSGVGTSADVAACASAIQAYEVAKAARNSALGALFAAGTQGITSAQRAALTNIRANEVWGLAPEYLVATRSESDWIAIRDALAAKRAAAKAGTALDSKSAQVLAVVDAEPAAAAAKSALAAGLGSVAAAWNQATAQ